LPYSEYETLREDNRDAETRCCDAIVQMLSQGRKEPYCIFAVNDAIAQLVYKAAEQFNLIVGKDIFLVGFDDLPLCERLDPPLSSVHQSAEQVGYEGAKLLYEELAGHVDRPIHKVLPNNLVIRASSGNSVDYASPI
jgi:LacI family transcriptional regulator